MYSELPTSGLPSMWPILRWATVRFTKVFTLRNKFEIMFILNLKFHFYRCKHSQIFMKLSVVANYVARGLFAKLEDIDTNARLQLLHDWQRSHKRNAGHLFPVHFSTVIGREKNIHILADIYWHHQDPLSCGFICRLEKTISVYPPPLIQALSIEI